MKRRGPRKATIEFRGIIGSGHRHPKGKLFGRLRRPLEEAFQLAERWEAEPNSPLYPRSAIVVPDPA